jgi:hypothetical protein
VHPGGEAGLEGRLVGRRDTLCPRLREVGRGHREQRLAVAAAALLPQLPVGAVELDVLAVLADHPVEVVEPGRV